MDGAHLTGSRLRQLQEADCAGAELRLRTLTLALFSQHCWEGVHIPFGVGRSGDPGNFFGDETNPLGLE